MSDAPERIWADANRYWSSVGWRQSNEFVGDVEYVRADIVQELTAERDRLLEALRRLERASTEVASCGARTGPQWLKLTVANLSARAALKGESHD